MLHLVGFLSSRSIYICTHVHVCVYIHILFNIKFNTICNVPEFSSTSCQKISLDSQKLSYIKQCDSPHSSCHEHSQKCVLLAQSIWLSKSEDNVTNIWLFFHLILGQKPTVFPSFILFIFYYLFIYLFSIPEIHQRGYRTCQYIAVGWVQNEARH